MGKVTIVKKVAALTVAYYFIYSYSMTITILD